MKATILTLVLFFLGISQSFSQTMPPLPILCLPITTSPTWNGLPNKLFVRCPQIDVGIGTNNPIDRLHIATEDNTGLTFVPSSTDQRTKISFLDESQNVNWHMTAYNNFGGGYGNIFQLSSQKGGNFWVSNTTMMVGDYFDLDGCTDCSDYLLFVRKGIRTEEVKVDIATGNWADYVFKPDYNLMPLNEVRTFIQTNGHLPNVPKADQVEAEGIKVGEMNAKLLEKIEELTLYILELEERIQKVEGSNDLK